MTPANNVRYNSDMKNWTPKEIKSLRRKYKLSQPALGNLLGVSGNYIYMIEKGVRTPGKPLRLLLDCVEKQLTEKEKGKGVKKHGNRHL